MKLRCVQGPLQGEEFHLVDGDYVLGRDPSGNNATPLPLNSRTVSRNHCKLTVKDGMLEVTDLKSANGIRINRQKVIKGFLRKSDQLDVGEFSFVLDEDTATSKKEPTNAGEVLGSENKIPRELPPALKKLLERFERLDLKYKVLAALLVGGAIVHWVSTAPALSDTRRALLNESFEIARKSVRSLGERNKRELAEGSNFLLDCEFLKGSQGVIASYLLDARGKVVCPIGQDIAQDELIENALYRGETSDNCKSRIVEDVFEDCDLVFPVREWKDKQAQYVTVGVARIQYAPQDAFLSMQNLHSLSFKTFVLSLLILLGVWWVWQRWQQRGVLMASEGVHLAVSGTAQNVEKLESFAALDPLIDEINRLISKSNQMLSANTADKSVEASFLHLLLPQVLLLEERAVMVVDKDNQMIAASASLSAAIPVNVDAMNIHVTDAITDTHLQGELISFLNDLSSSNEVMDRALSLADRVVQARGLPLFLHDDYVASILIF